MRIIADWQYRYIEKCLFSYEHLVKSQLDTEIKVVDAINAALEYFKDSSHAIMITHFYIAGKGNKQRNSGNFTVVCETLLHTEEPNGYVMRREIVYRIAMNCYALGVFKLDHI